MQRGTPIGRWEGLSVRVAGDTRKEDVTYQNSSKFTEPERSVSNILRTLSAPPQGKLSSRAYLIIMRTV